MKKVRAWIDEHFNRIRIIETSFCDVPYEILLGVGRFDPAQTATGAVAPPHRHDAHQHDTDSRHRETFSTWTYETDQPMSLDALREAARKFPGSIFRCKGIVYAAEAPERRAVLQVVGRRADVSLLDEWNGRKPSTRIVAIGAPGTFDGEVLRARFDQCLSAASEPESPTVSRSTPARQETAQVSLENATR